MNKTLVTIALATVPVFAFSACNGNATGGSGINAMPSAVQAKTPLGTRVHRNDNGPQDLHAGGADFPAYAYSDDIQPVGNYNQVQPPPGTGSLFASAGTTGTIYYCITGSGDGRKAFEGSGDSGFPPTGPCAGLGQTPTGFGGRQDPLDFVGTSVAMSSSEYSAYKANREPPSGTNWGEPFEYPNIGGPIVYPFRSSDFSVSKIKFSAWSYCAIANGTISNWNDPALTADNGGTSLTGGASQPITFYFRADSGGTTYAFTNHLSSACTTSWKAPYNKAPYESSGHSAAWTYGVNSNWPGPGSSGHPNSQFVGEQGSAGIVAAVASTHYGTGYLEGSYAKGAGSGIGQALLQNGVSNGLPVFVDPTYKPSVVRALSKVTSANIQYGEGSDGVSLGTSRPECVLYVDPSHFVLPPAHTYPIVNITYLLFYGNNNGVHVPDKQTLIKFLVTKKASNIVNGFEYASLSSSVQTAVLNALNGSGSVKPCLQ